MLEFADIDIERRAAQMAARERLGQGRLVDNLAAGEVDEHAACLHAGEAVAVEQPGRLRRPLAADHDKIAFRQQAVEIPAAPIRLKPGGNCAGGGAWRRVPTTRMPSAAQSRPTSRPMPPTPTTQAVLPASNSGR